MSHEKVFGFCENLCETEVEQISNKVTGISSSSTDTQYPSAKAVYGALNQFLIGRSVNTPWVSTPEGGSQWFFYESADTTLYKIPTPNCIVLVFKKTNTRGVAFAFGWDGVSTNKSLYKNTCHDIWRGWAPQMIAPIN